MTHFTKTPGQNQVTVQAYIAPETASANTRFITQNPVSSWIINAINTPTYQYVLLAGVMLTAVLLRFYKLGTWSFWGDEMFTVGGREDGFNYSIFRQSISLALIQAVTAWRGVTEWNARLVPALFGIITIPTIYFFIKKIFNPATGLLVALLLAISPWHLYWSQNARFYTALLLFYALASFFFYLGLEQDRPWYFIFSLIFLGLAAKERLFALFFIPVVILYILLLWLLPFAKPPGLRLRNLIIFFAPGLIPGLILLLPYLRNLSGWLAGFGYANNNPFWLLAGFVYYVGLPIVCLAAAGALYLLWQQNRAALFFTIGALMPLLSLMAIAPFHYTANRYAFVALLSWIVLASTAVTALLPKISKPTPFLAFGLLLILISQPLSEDLLYYRFQNGNRDNWKDAFAYVQAHRATGDLVASPNTELGDYYLQEQTIGFANLDLASIEQNSQTTWFIEDMVARETHPDIHNWLERHAALISVFDVHFQARTFTMRVYRYRPLSPGT